MRVLEISNSQVEEHCSVSIDDTEPFEARRLLRGSPHLRVSYLAFARIARVSVRRVSVSDSVSRISGLLCRSYQSARLPLSRVRRASRPSRLHVRPHVIRGFNAARSISGAYHNGLTSVLSCQLEAEFGKVRVFACVCLCCERASSLALSRTRTCWSPRSWSCSRMTRYYTVLTRLTRVARPFQIQILTLSLRRARGTNACHLRERGEGHGDGGEWSGG